MESTTHTPKLKDYLAYFLKLGTLDFGGPAALVGAMEKELVEDRGWLNQADFHEGLALAQIAPGPLAAQLSIYIGWKKAGIIGRALVGLAFIIPSFVICVLLASFYLRYGSLSWIQPVFKSVGAAVIGIIVLSAYRLQRKIVGKDRLLLLLWGVSVIYTAFYEQESVVLFLISGIFLSIIKNYRTQPTTTLNLRLMRRF